MAYSWIKTKETDAALQMVTIGQNAGNEPFRTLLKMTDADIAQWRAQAAEQKWLQIDEIGAVEGYKKALYGARDGLTKGPDSRPYVRPTFTPVPPPVAPAGITLMDDFYDWANVFIKAARADPEFTRELQEQLGLVVSAEGDVERGPEVSHVKLGSGGVVKVDCYVGNAALVICQLNVDGAGWPIVEDGGKYQKILAASHFEFTVPAGSAHTVEIRSAFADKGGNMLGVWSEVTTISSLA